MDHLSQKQQLNCSISKLLNNIGDVWKEYNALHKISNYQNNYTILHTRIRAFNFNISKL